MSTHVIPVIKITEIFAHPNADMLELIPVKGWMCAVRKGDFSVGDLAVYIEPDYMVPVTTPWFSFLKEPSKFDQTYARIKAKKLRGVMSYGLIIPVPVDETGDYITRQEGENLLEQLAIIRWEPPVQSGARVPGFAIKERFFPDIAAALTKFDLENIKNFAEVIPYGEEVIITEKIHGANARYVFADNEFFVGTRNTWLREPTAEERAEGHKEDAWWRIANSETTGQGIRKFCVDNPGVVLYGELFGNVQDLKYARPTEVDFAAFAALCHNGVWRNTEQLFEECRTYGIPTVPVLYTGPHDMKIAATLAEMDTNVTDARGRTITGQLSEGVVITTREEKMSRYAGRNSFKYVSDRYLLRRL